MDITAKHSNVFYIYKGAKDEGLSFQPVEKATACRNSHGLDLFRYKGNIYEGRTGYKFITAAELYNLDFKIKSIGGIGAFNKKVEEQLEITGESPRYTRPGERKKDLFPPGPEKLNTVFAKGADGHRHYYYRFYNEDGVEFFTLQNEKEFNRTVFVRCGGYMLAVDQHHRLEEALNWYAGLKNGVKGEVERIFNESMADPQKWADLFFAEIMGRVDAAKAHNAPIREAREQENRQRDAEREAKRATGEQTAKEKYGKAIKEAEGNLMDKKEVANSGLPGGKSLIMQLFREHEIAVPLRTQGWVMGSLQSVFYNPDREGWGYRYHGNPSTAFWGCFDRLLAAVQTKQQFEEAARNGGPSPPFGIHPGQEEENDMEI